MLYGSDSWLMYGGACCLSKSRKMRIGCSESPQKGKTQTFPTSHFEMIFRFCFNSKGHKISSASQFSLSLSLSCSLAAVLPSLRIICIKEYSTNMHQNWHAIFLLLALMLESTQAWVLEL